MAAVASTDITTARLNRGNRCWVLLPRGWMAAVDLEVAGNAGWELVVTAVTCDVGAMPDATGSCPCSRPECLRPAGGAGGIAASPSTFRYKDVAAAASARREQSSCG